MAAPIRPPVWPQAPADIRPGRADTRVAAQKAFFEAALAGKPAPTPQQSQAASQPAATATPAPSRVSAAPQTSAADTIPRPGSIIDIRV